MIPPGFLGTRADLLVDLALVSFVALPVLMLGVTREARAGRLERHRRLQMVLFAAMTLAVGLLEFDIRWSGGSRAFMARGGGVQWLRPLLLVHIAIATATWFGWIAHLVAASRRFPRGPLPGAYSPTHRRSGRRVWFGVAATALTGTVLYVGAFVV